MKKNSESFLFVAREIQTSAQIELDVLKTRRFIFFNSPPVSSVLGSDAAWSPLTGRGSLKPSPKTPGTLGSASPAAYASRPQPLRPRTTREALRSRVASCGRAPSSRREPLVATGPGPPSAPLRPPVGFVDPPGALVPDQGQLPA